MPEVPSQEVITRTEQYQREVNYYNRWQRFFLLIGAFYDSFFGVTLYFAPYWTTTFFHLIVPPPGEKVLWLLLDGIFLIIMGMLYVVAARDPARYMGIVLVCVVGKIWSVGFYVYHVWHGAPPMYLSFAGLDFVFFFLHIWALGPDRKARVKDALKWVDLYP